MPPVVIILASSLRTWGFFCCVLWLSSVERGVFTDKRTAMPRMSVKQAGFPEEIFPEVVLSVKQLVFPDDFRLSGITLYLKEKHRAVLPVYAREDEAPAACLRYACSVLPCRAGGYFMEASLYIGTKKSRGYISPGILYGNQCRFPSIDDIICTVRIRYPSRREP